jgi:mRNA-degrading endonuclease toxin of MazEF toxin-antitoxin module
VAPYVPARGDLIWLQFKPQAGHAQAGHRPAVVISPSSYNRRVGLALLETDGVLPERVGDEQQPLPQADGARGEGR